MGVRLVSTAIHVVVEGAVVISKYDAVFGLALVADVVHCVPKSIGVVLGWGVDGEDINGCEVGEGEG